MGIDECCFILIIFMEVQYKGFYTGFYKAETYITIHDSQQITGYTAN